MGFLFNDKRHFHLSNQDRISLAFYIHLNSNKVHFDLWSLHKINNIITNTSLTLYLLIYKFLYNQQRYHKPSSSLHHNVENQANILLPHFLSLNMVKDKITMKFIGSMYMESGKLLQYRPSQVHRLIHGHNQFVSSLHQCLRLLQRNFLCPQKFSLNN